jgi:hypothetical protein
LLVVVEDKLDRRPEQRDRLIHVVGVAELLAGSDPVIDQPLAIGLAAGGSRSRICCSSSMQRSQVAMNRSAIASKRSGASFSARQSSWESSAMVGQMPLGGFSCWRILE